MKQQTSIEEEILRQMYEQQQRMVHEQTVRNGNIQNDIDAQAQNQREVAIIVAIDQYRGYAKEGKIPWYYTEDFKWFKSRTDGKICIMGRKTYEDINERLGEKAKESVLPGRKCFVVSTTLTELPNATVIKSISEFEQHLDPDDNRPAYIIGGGQLFTEGISLASIVMTTIINKDYECDQFFPTEYLEQKFFPAQTFKVNTNDELRFVIWKRKPS